MRLVLRQIRVLVVAAAGLSGLAMAADPDHGSDLAKRWCACHVVDGDQKQANRTLLHLPQSHASRTLRRKKPEQARRAGHFGGLFAPSQYKRTEAAGDFDQPGPSGRM